MVKEGLAKKDGYCPCRLERTPENKCMCKEFKEAFRKHIPEIKRGFNYLVVARPQAAESDFAQIENNLLSLLAKAGATGTV